jgi:Spy/CpxP family protein refolding chaperone
MHPGFMWHWKHAQRAGHCGPHAHQSHERGGGEAFAAPHGGDDFEFGAGPFGVRRPLRFLAHKLDLSEKQVAELASVLDELKTERAQAAVDHRRSTSAFADAIAGDAFDQAKVSAAATERVKSAERLRDAVTRALAKIHALLEPEQRAKLSYLLKTGALSI